MPKKEYRNVIRSKDAIKGGLVSMLERGNSLESINVKALASEAKVTRGTFYNHYSSVYDVAEEIENRFIGQLTEILVQSDMSAGHLRDFFASVSDYLKSYLTDAKAIAKCIPLRSFIDLKVKLNQAIRDAILKKDPSLAYDSSKMLKARIFANGLAASYFDFFSGASEDNIGDVTDAAYEMTLRLFPEK